MRWLGFCVCLGALTLSRATWAETPGGPVSREEAPARQAVVIVLVGAAGDSSELTLLVSELLGRQGLETRFLRESAFESRDLLADRERDRSVWVYVTLEGGQSARLYFRGPGGRRFLLRELALPGGLDALAREGIAQVVDSSVHSLLYSSAGLSREQARNAIERVQRETPPQPPPPPAPPRPQPIRRVPAPAPNLSGLIGARYSAEYSGRELGIAHGPGLELGIGFRRPLRIRAKLGGDRFFAQRIAARDVGASLQTTRVALGLDLEWPLGVPIAVVAALSGGTDITRIEPRSAGSSVALAPKSTDLVPFAAADVRFVLRRASWAFGLGLLANVALANTHYDLRRGSGTKRVAELWPVRPGAVLAVGWSP